MPTTESLFSLRRSAAKHLLCCTNHHTSLHLKEVSCVRLCKAVLSGWGIILRAFPRRKIMNHFFIINFLALGLFSPVFELK